MSRGRRVGLIALGVVVLFVGGVIARRLVDRDAEHLAGAELLAAGGNESVFDLGLGRASADDVALDDLPLGLASLLSSGDDSTLYVLFEQEPSGGLIQAASADGQVIRAGAVTTGDRGFEEPVTGVGLADDGSTAVAHGREVGVIGFNWTGLDVVDAGFSVGAVGWAEDGSLLFGSAAGPVIDAVDENGGFRRLLGSDDDAEAAVHAGDDLGPIVALLGLPNGRVAFVAETADGFELYVLDDGSVTRLADGDTNPVASAGTRPGDPEVRADRYPMAPIAPGPDGRILATGLGPEGHPQISLVDPDNGDVEVIAELEGVEPTVEEPVSAAAVGDDLVFLADGRIWKLDDAFAGG